MNDNTYIDILIESLIKKSKVLDEIAELNANQVKIFSSAHLDFDEFRETADKKGELAEKLDSLDDGFEEVYNRVKEELKENKDAHKDQIARLKELIKEITDKSVKISVEEKKIDSLVHKKMNEERRDIKKRRDSNAAMSAYQKEMSKIDTINPQFMDKRN